MGWDQLGQCLPAAQVTLASGARGMAEPRGATLPAPSAAWWPSLLPWGPAWHGTVSCTTEGTVSWCHLCPWELPSLSPKSHQGRPRCQSCSPPAVEQGIITHVTQHLAHIPSVPYPQLLHSPTVGQGTPGTHGPHWTCHHCPSHTAPSTRHLPAACPAAPPPWHRQGNGWGGTAAQEGPWGTGPGGQDSGQVEVSPSALFYQP